MNIVTGAQGGFGPGAGWRLGADEAAANHCVAHTLRADGFDASEDGTGRGTPLVPVGVRSAAPTLTTTYGKQPDSSDTNAGPMLVPMATAFDARQSDVIQYGDKTGPLDTCGFTMGVQTATAVRRLMPIECERLQGFADNYTAIDWKGKPAKDGPRYKALGNSWAVNCARWIGQRLEIVEGLKA